MGIYEKESIVNQLLESLLVVLIGFALRWFLAAIGVEIDDTLFNTLVAAMVLWILRLLGVELTFRAIAGIRHAFGK